MKSRNLPVAPREPDLQDLLVGIRFRCIFEVLIVRAAVMNVAWGVPHSHREGEGAYGLFADGRVCSDFGMESPHGR
jgi:hypothetical protein